MGLQAYRLTGWQVGPVDRFASITHLNLIRRLLGLEFLQLFGDTPIVWPLADLTSGERGARLNLVDHFE